MMNLNGRFVEKNCIEPIMSIFHDNARIEKGNKGNAT